MSVQILQWYKEMGVDEIIGDNPINRLTPIVNTTQPKTSSETQRPAFTTTILQTPEKWEQKSREIASNCNNIEELKIAIESFDGCGLKQTATNMVFADGNPDAKIMIIGEPPNTSEDASGIPFDGESGNLLNKMLSCIGLDRKDDIYITNNLFWRPPGNRRPTPEEIKICLPFVERHIFLAKPEILIIMGGTAVDALLKTSLTITRARGKFYEYSNDYLDNSIPVFTTFHPSYLIRQPRQKHLSWSDLLSIKHFLETGEKINVQ